MFVWTPPIPYKFFTGAQELKRIPFDTKGILLLDARWSQRLVSSLLAIDSGILGMLISMDVPRESCFPFIMLIHLSDPLSECVNEYLIRLKLYFTLGLVSQISPSQLPPFHLGKNDLLSFSQTMGPGGW